MDPDLNEKRRLRQGALAAREAVADREAREAAIQGHIAELVAGRFHGAVVAAYHAMRGEVDPLPGLSRHVGPLVLPVVAGARRPLVFRRFTPGEELDAGHFGTRHPAANAPELTPRLVLMPLAGFDRAGHRLGYGGGFYDRTLAVLRAAGPVAAVGVAFRCQEVAPIPAEPTDQPLDAVVTEDGVRAFASV